MKRILSLIFVVLTMSVMIFAKEMPKEVKYPSNKLSLSENNEILYDGILYTGKIVYYDSSYMNLKDGHLEGKTYMGGGELKFSFNIVNGEFDGNYIQKGKSFGINNDMLLNFKNGKIKTYIGYTGSIEYDFTFDSNGNANGISKDNRYNMKYDYIDGIAKAKNGFVLKANTGDEGNEIIISLFDEKGRLIKGGVRGYHMNGDFIERNLFPSLFGELPDEQIELLKIAKEQLEKSK